MAAAFALAVVQETLERLHSYQDGDCSGILLRLEYVNRIIINCGNLHNSIVAGIGSTITCLLLFMYITKRESIFLSRVEGRGFHVEGHGSMSRVEGNLFFFQIFFLLEKVTIDALKK